MARSASGSRPSLVRLGLYAGCGPGRWARAVLGAATSLDHGLARGAGHGMILDKMADQIVPDPPYVLLVESNQPLRERLGTALYASGFVPLLAADAIDAVHYMAGVSTPVLVILDLDSVEEPAELLARFRADARWSRVPVVATGSDAELLGDLGADGVLPKPFDAERLVNLGRETIARPR